MLSDVKRKELAGKACLIFINLPIGNNSYCDSPIRGNQSLAQVAVNRIDSITKHPDEFKFMVDVVVRALKATAGKTIEKITVNHLTKDLVDIGLFDSKGNMIKKWKKD